MKKILLVYTLAAVAAFGEANRLMDVDAEGVLRYRDNGEEVALFGVNYYPPFSNDFAALKARRFDHKEAIRQDLAHLQRMGLTTLRLHCFEREFSDKDGNFIDNEHVDILDYLIAECAKRDIYVALTPIAWWGSKGASPHCFASRYDTIQEMISDRASWGYMANFLEQFGKHVNRYNGKTYAEDPAIPVFELINEPLYEKDFPKEDITAFVNALVAGLRKSGTKKPIFFSVWQNTQVPVSKANIQGVTHGWYPSGLLNRQTLTENYLPKIDKFLNEFYDPALKGKARMIYEFDCADIHQTTMYPAMARSFRNAGAQIAAQFQYDLLELAPNNQHWQTHYLNLLYTPGKAVGLAIAAEVFRRIPRHFQYGKYPASCTFGDFKLSYEKDLSEMVTETDFLYTNDTATMPPNPLALKRVWGVGSSPVVRYGGTGAYFLDKLGDGEWLLEIYPDALMIKDPYVGGLQEKVRLLDNDNGIVVNLPDLGNDFSVWREEKSGRAFEKSAVNGGVILNHAGRYRLVRKGMEAKFDIASLNREFVLPSIPKENNQPVFNVKVDSFSEDADGIMTATGVASKDCTRLEVVVTPMDGGEAVHAPLTEMRKFSYRAVLPKEKMKKGMYLVHVEHEANGKTLVFPGGKTLTKAVVKPGQTWSALRIDEKTPLGENRTSDDGHVYSYSYNSENKSIRIAADGFGTGRAATGMRFTLTPPPVDAAVTTLRLRLRGGENTTAVEVGVIHDGSHAYGKPVMLTTTWQDVEIPLAQLPALWNTQDGVANAALAKELSLITGTWLFPTLREKPHWVEIQRADWVYRPDEPLLHVRGKDDPPVLVDFDNGVVPLSRGPSLSISAFGMDEGRLAWRWSAASFNNKGGGQDFSTARPAVSPSFKQQLNAEKTYKTIVLTARALYPWTDKVEMVFIESDGSAWGMNVPLTTEWQRIRIPIEKLYLFRHWGGQPENRGGEGDKLNVRDITGCSFCFGKFLYRDTYDRPHALEIQEAVLEE
ncbi:MAG: cellulase family glycosylhydrolase [Victivallales bacterium]|nr:cellulase family glycosylhydrolase [Victivallales bacterium]